MSRLWYRLQLKNLNFDSTVEFTNTHLWKFVWKLCFGLIELLDRSVTACPEEVGRKAHFRLTWRPALPRGEAAAFTFTHDLVTLSADCTWPHRCTVAQFRHRRCAAVGALLVLSAPPLSDRRSAFGCSFVFSHSRVAYIILFGSVGCVINRDWLQANFPFIFISAL